MSIPKEPRQQMINIMYLVLIAMLAMNVSNEIVNAFKLLDRGIQDSNSSIDKKISSSFKSFQAAVDKNKSGQVYLDRANQASQYSQEFITYISGLQDTIQTRAGRKEGAEWADKLDDQDAPTRFMVTEGKGEELKEKILEYRQKFLDLFKPEGNGNDTLFSEKDYKAFGDQLLLKIEDVPDDAQIKDANWGTYTFNQMPLVAVITLLDKFKNDAKNSEAAAIDALKSKVSEEEILFDSFDVAIVPSGKKMIQGETFNAEVFLTASSSQSKPRIVINGTPFTADASGRAQYSARASATGRKSINAEIHYKDGFGNPKVAKQSFQYDVVPPPDHVAVVSADKMNVFYIGLDNPITASITGIRNDKVRVSIDNGTINKSGGAGKYNVRVSSPGSARVSLSAKKDDGSTVNGSQEFRIKRIPDPIPMIGKSKGGVMKSGEFRAQQGLRAELENFVYDAKYKVTGFEVTLSQKGKDLQIAPNSGGRYSGRAADLVKRASPGDIVYFDKIRAKGPDGTTRNLGSIAFRIQ